MALKGKRYLGAPLLHCKNNTKPLRFEFEGRAIGAFILAGPDAAKIRFSIDDQAKQEIDLYHHYSKSLHYPRSVIFAHNLKPGKHSIALEPVISRDRNAVRIMEFCINNHTMSQNPFLRLSGNPKWENLKPDHIRGDITQALEKAENNLQKIRDLQPDETTFSNTVKALEHASEDLYYAWGLITHLDSVCNSPELARSSQRDVTRRKCLWCQDYTRSSIMGYTASLFKKGGSRFT